MQNTTIRLMIVDDHTLVHVGLSGMLEACAGIELVGAASSGEEAVAMVCTIQPHVVLMDLVMPGMGGIEATRQVKQVFPGAQVLVLTSFEDMQKIHHALAAGAVGCLLKNMTAYELECAIHSAYAGRVTLAPEAARLLVEYSQQQESYSKDLTEREIEVLGFLVRGLSNAQIAEALTVSPFTIKAHVSNILTKLGLRTRAEAAAFAVQNHLVTYSPGLKAEASAASAGYLA